MKPLTARTPSTHPLTHPLLIALLALLCCALWGSASPAIKIGYELLEIRGVPSTLLFAGVRFAAAGVLTVLIYSLAGRRLLYPKRQNLPRVLTVSAFQTVIQYVFFYIGLANTTSVKGTVASGSSAFFCVLVASLIFRQEKLTFKKILACLLGFTGILLVNVQGLTFTLSFLGDGFVILSTVSYAVSSVLMKRFSAYEDPVVISGYQFIIGGSLMAVLGACLGGTMRLTDGRGVLLLVYLALLSAVAYAVWGLLLKYNPVSRVSVFSFTTPVFGTLLSMLLLPGQSGVDPWMLALTLLLVCAGILLLNYTPRPTRGKGTSAPPDAA